jgi:hypothetical protein
VALWVPPAVARDLREETLAHNAATLGMFDFEGPVFDEWNPELKKLDPFLKLGKAKPKAFAVGVIPGFFHLIRINPGAPLWTQPLYDQAYHAETGDYKYIEPTSQMLQLLRERDMQNMQVTRARLRAIEEKKQQEEKAKANRLERIADEGWERWKAYTQVRIPFHNDQRWSQNVNGRRGVASR